jgi:hypothetical protein
MLTREETMKKYDEIYAGLAARNFGPLNGAECSQGKCHTPDEKHYVLITDGLLIYSTIPYWDQTQYVPGSIAKDWHCTEFEFDELDKLMNR